MNSLEKIVLVLCAALVMVSFVGCVCGAEITSISLTITAPETGGEVAQTAQSTSSGIESATIKWTPDVSGTFSADKKYSATITVKAAGDNSFAESVTASVNKIDATVKSRENSIVVIEFNSFSKTTKIPINSLSITEISEPVNNGTPDNDCKIASTPVNGVMSSGTVSWTEKGVSATKFEAGKTYVASITVTPEPDYEFTSTSSATVGSKTAASVNIEDGNVVVTQEYTVPLEATPINSLTIKDVTAPVRGANVVKTISIEKDPPESVSYPGDFEWYTGGSKFTGDKFADDTQYTAKFTLNAASTESVQYTLGASTLLAAAGSESCEIVPSNDGKTATVSITYPKTGKTVHSLSITDIDIPYTGNDPDTVAKTTESAVTLGSIVWKEGEDGRSLLTGEKFSDGKSYTAEITATASGTSDFKTDIKKADVLVNGDSATSVQLSGNGKVLTITYKFPAAQKSIGSVELDINQPVPGETPQQKATILKVDGLTSSENILHISSAAIAWKVNGTAVGSSDKFVEGKKYTAVVTLVPASGYSFKKDLTVKINDDSIASSAITSKDNNREITYNFADGTYISQVAITLNPVAGKAFSSIVPTTTTKGVKIGSNVAWEKGSDTKIQNGQNYYVSFTVETDGKYQFTDDVEVRVNGETKLVTVTKSSSSLNVRCIPTTCNLITEVAATIAAPVAGQAASVRAELTSDVDGIKPTLGTISWSPSTSSSGGKFAGSTEYTVSIPVNLGTDAIYAEAASINATVNGKHAEVTRKSDTQVVLSYKFPATGYLAATPSSTQTQKPVSQATTTATPTPTPTEEPELDEPSLIPNPLQIFHEFIELLLSLFDPATYGIGVEEPEPEK